MLSSLHRALQMSLTYDPRMSLGARSIAGGPPPPRQTYSFPILSYKEIVQCTHELQFRLTEAELAEADKHKESIRQLYEHLIERCTGITREDMNQPAFAGISALSFAQLHEQSIPELAFFRACSKMMQVCGIHDFSIKDVLSPDPKRVRRHLSAIVNFAKFREERLVVYSEITNKRDALVEALKTLQDEESDMSRELQKLNEQTAMEASSMAQLEKECQIAEADLDELNRQQAQIRQQNGELKQHSNDLKDRITETTQALEEAIAERYRTQSQIVRSPERVRREITTAAKEVEAEKHEGLEAERNAREMNMRVASVQKAQKEVAKAVKAIEDIEAELAKQKLANKELKDAQRSVQANRQKGAEATVQVENLKRQVSRFEERLVHLRRQAKLKDEAIERAHGDAQSELLAVEKSRRTQQTAVDESEAEVARLQHQLGMEKSEHQKQREEMTEALKSLHAVISDHQRRLRETLAACERQGQMS